MSKKLWELNIPLIASQSIGFIGYMRVQIQEHNIIESHPEYEMPDLRLDKPFPSLKAYLDSINLDAMDLKDHSHTPYVVILYKCLQEWSSKGNDLPKTYKEKLQFIQFIRDKMWKDEQGIPTEEENFEEAIRAVNTSIGVTQIPSNASEVLEDARCINLNAKVNYLIDY